MCQLKANIPVIHRGISFGDSNIKSLQTLAWWVMDLTLQGRNVDLNNFGSDIMSDTIGEFQIEFEDTRDSKGGMSKPKTFSYEKWTQ